MPADSPVDDLSHLVQRVETSSGNYALAATRLSLKISAFEKKLQSMLGKVEASVAVEPPHYLGFRRLKDDWVLVLHDSKSQNMTRLTSADIEWKAKAAVAFAELLSQMHKIQNERMDGINKALRLIPDVETEKEGA